jgi:hypothetical protein
MLASSHTDKQPPMAMLGTAATSGEAPPKYKKFTVIRGHGTYHVMSAHLLQNDIHMQYRDALDVNDLNYSKRQGGFSFEDT